MKQTILNEFENRKYLYTLFSERVTNLISDLLRQKSINIHNLSHRVKEINSLSKKIDRKLGKYSELTQITDIVGIRVITHLESEVDLIEKLIKEEFNVDIENSIDKRELNADQFGYRSLHLVVSLNESRSGLAEYCDYKDLKCEIQIRSILQHAWAEIEHDLGYKGKNQIPDKYKRNFNRLSALLETADKEFDRLKTELSTYENEVSELINKEPENVGIDKASLQKYNQENDILNEARNFLAKKIGWSYQNSIENLESIVSRFKFFKILTIKDLDESLKSNKNLFFKFLDVFTNNFTYPEISSEIILYYFQHFLASKDEDEKLIEEYLHYETIIEGTAEEFINHIKEAKKLQLT